MNKRSIAIRRLLVETLAPALLVATLSVAAPASAAEAPEPGTPAWHLMAAEANAHARGRTADLLANPELQQRRAELCSGWMSDECRWLDPYRLDWAGTRGRVVDVHYENRYGVDIAGTLSLPVDAGQGPFPTVVFVNGYGNRRTDYQGMVHGLVEAGYAVLGFDPQCQGHSGCEPAPEFCDPEGAWREPQEFGVREHGRCAGNPPDPDEDPVTGLTRAANDLAWVATTLAGCRIEQCDWDMIAATYTPVEARHVLGTIDALDWLLSDDNPHRHEVDEGRLGVVGHSMGGHAALVAGNGDPRVHAAVSFDSYGHLPSTVLPRVPTLFLHGDGQDHLGPYQRPPDPEGPTGLRTTRAFAAAGVDTMALALRGTTHQEFLWVPPEEPHPMVHQSRLGERIALYYTRAWLDRALRADAAGAAGAARLTAERFDSSVDGSSIGAGGWDPVEQRNIPYTIAGGVTAEHVSPFFRSSMAFGGIHCADLREDGCPEQAGPGEQRLDVGLDQPAFWQGEAVAASPDDRDGFMAGWSYDLHVRHPAPALRVSLDLVPEGLRDWADGRGPETATWSTWGLTNGPAVWLGAVGARFTLEVETPSGEVHRSAMTTGYSTEVFIDRPEAGAHRVRVVPQDDAEFVAAVNRRSSGREGLSFRLRAQLNNGKLVSPQGELLPNLRIVPPFEIGFAAPTYTFGPSPSSPPGTAHGCMVEEHEEHAFDQLVDAATGGGQPAPPPVHCLRFSAGIENVGNGPLVMSAPMWPDDPAHPGWWDLQEDNFDFPAFQRVLIQRGTETSYRDGELGSAGIMRFHPFHGHHHYENAYGYTLYELRDDELVAVGPSQKRGFNPLDEKLADWESFDQCRRASRTETAGPGGCAYTAADGIAVLGRGWGDIYEWNRGGQYAEVPPDELGRPRQGTYVLVGTADPEGVIRETDRSDNSSYASFVITDTGVEVCERGYGAGPGDPGRRVIEVHDCGG